VKLKDLIKDVPVRRTVNFNNVEVEGLAYDSRRVRANYLFVAIPGSRQDGHAYLYDAVARGAKVVVVERKDLVVPSDVVSLLVDNSRLTLARLASTFFGNPSRRLKVVGITGTKGKTTSAYLLHALHQAAGERCGLISTISYQIGERAISSFNTTPESLDLQEMMAEMENSGCQAVVMEVSSHGSAQGRVTGIHFDTAVLTNVAGHEHLDYHGTFRNYLQAKLKFFEEYLSSSIKEDKLALVNLDDPSASRFLKAVAEKNIRVVTWGQKKRADIKLLSYTLERTGNHLQILVEDKVEPFFSPLRGLGNVFNVLLTVAYGWARGFPLKVIRTALSQTAVVPGRFELVEEGQPFSVVVDYAHTADSLRSLLTSVRALRPRRIILVFGCGGDRDRSKRPLMGALGARLADLVIITSDNPRSENPLRIAEDIRRGIPLFFRRKAVVVIDRRQAIQEAIGLADAGDFVVIAGKGHETYQIFQQTVVPFDDRLEARRALQSLSQRSGAPGTG